MKFITSDDAVSESLGFVLLAFIMMTTMAIIIMVGYPMYQNSLNDGHMKNIEEGFYLLSSNANKVALYETPTQSSELKLYGGSLSLGIDGNIKVSYTFDDATGEHTEYASVPLQLIEYSLNNVHVAYVLGGVCKSKDDYSFLVKDPSAYQYTTNGKVTMVIPLVEYQNPETAFAGTGLARIEIRNPIYARLSGTLSYPKATNVQAKEIKIEISGKYKDCLSQYFIDNLGFQDKTSEEPSPAQGTIYLKNTPASPINLYIARSLLYVTVN